MSPLADLILTLLGRYLPGRRKLLPGALQGFLSRPWQRRRVALAAIGLLMAGTAGANSLEDDVLFAAAHDGNLQLFRQILKAGADINATDATGNTVLVLAAIRDRDEIVSEILTHAVDVDGRGSLGMTALGIATAHNAPAIVTRLLRAGANPDIPDAGGVTPLASALRLNRMMLADRLLAANADPNIADRDGVTPLHIVAEKGDEAMTIRLLLAGADPNALDRDRRSPLFLALLNRHHDAAEALVRRPQTDLALVSQGYPPAFWAQQMGFPDLARSIAARLRKG